MKAPKNPVGSASDDSAVTGSLVHHVDSDPGAFAEAADGDSRSRLLWNMLTVRRSRHRLGQRLMARRMKTTQSVVSELEQGKTDPRLSTLQKYARAIGCRVDLMLVDTSDGSDRVVWCSSASFPTWRGGFVQLTRRTLPYNHAVVPVERKSPEEVWGSKFGLQHNGADKQHWVRRWQTPTHTRNVRVRDFSTAEPDDLLRLVSRGERS